jgi:hypothetical protein
MDSRILLFDTENTPNLGYTWGVYDQNVIKVVREWWMLCFSYKWLGDKTVRCVAQPDFDGYEDDLHNDYHVMAKMRELLDEADVVVAHNGDRFDIRKVNARLLFHGIDPPSHYQTIDTLKVARQQFAMNTNKLDDIGQRLGFGRKTPHTGFKLWEDCMAGDPAAWRLMKRYAKQDLVLLEELYLMVRPWMKTHPNLSNISGHPTVCPRCEQAAEFRLAKMRATATGKVRQYQCHNCRGYFSERTQDSEIPRPDFKAG